MQNDFLARSILPKCFISDIQRISMETSDKEKFLKIAYKRMCMKHTHIHYTL